SNSSTKTTPRMTRHTALATPNVPSGSYEKFKSRTLPFRLAIPAHLLSKLQAVSFPRGKFYKMELRAAVRSHAGCETRPQSLRTVAAERIREARGRSRTDVGRLCRPSPCRLATRAVACVLIARAGDSRVLFG